MSFSVNVTTLNRAQARKALLASIAARVAAATRVVNEEDSSSDSDFSDSESAFSSSESLTSTSTFTTASSARRVQLLSSTPCNKATVTLYRYAEGCSTVLTGGVMLGSPIPSRNDIAAKPAVWSKPTRLTKAPSSADTIGSWRRSVNV